MTTLRRSLLWGSLVGLVLGTGAGCGSSDQSAPAESVAMSKPPVPRAAPPAISGGTLLVLADGKTAVAADPDRDVVWLANLQTLSQTGRIDLQSGDEPGRLVQDKAGRVHVALRRGGAIVTIDPAANKIVDRRPACAAPRGLAYDAATDRLHLACAGGELVSFAASGGPAVRQLQLDSDLRDVIVSGGSLLVSRFRSAELLTIDETGTLRSRVKPAAVRSLFDPSNNDPMNMALAEPAVAWQLHALPDGSVAMLFERGTTAAIDTTRHGGYGNGQCKGAGVVSAALTLFGAGGEAVPGPTLPGVAYAVDFAVSADGSELSLIVPSDPFNSFSNVVTVRRADLAPPDPCGMFPSRIPPAPVLAGASVTAVGVAYDGSGRRVVQTRNRMYLVVGDSVITFKDAADVSNSGHALFHAATVSAMACVACHPEGGDDGRVWNFLPSGPRRTQNLRGGILATAPFHWDGDMTDMPKLMSAVLVDRMGGEPPSSDQVDAIARWLDAQPTIPKAAPADPQAVARGKELFASAAVGCASCHGGAHFTNNAAADVGTGKAFQVPSLIDVAARAPYMHSGCADTLAARFDPACGGGDRHGTTSQLTADQISDLISYLQTL